MSRTSHNNAAPAIDHSIPYEPHLDGLRALAVLAVVFFHCGFALFPQGFLGVDVFFVISGYLITSILRRELARTAQLRFGNFYLRRGRRLLPNLFLMLGVTALLAPVFLKSEEVQALGKSVVAAAAYLSNVHFFRQIGYFAPAAEDYPLLHTWSLAAEEQFYLVWPILLYFSYRGWRTSQRNHAAAINIVLGLLSLGACVAAQFGYRDHAFYLTPFRVWEFSFGALFVLSPPKRLLALLESSGAAATLISYCAVIGLIAVMCIPGWPDGLSILANMAAVLFAGLLIFCVPRSGRNAVSIALTSRPAGYIGNISYSLYLWHWPIIVFYRMMHPGESSVVDGLIALVLCVVPACAAYHLVEKPLRTSKRVERILSPARAAAIATLCTMLFVGIGLMLWRQGPTTYSDSTLELAARAAHDVNPRRADCLANYENTSLPPQQLCATQSTDLPAPTVFVWGDSHADALAPGLVDALPHGYRVIQRTKTGCAPLLGIDIELRGRDYSECTQFNSQVSAEVKATAQVALVVMAARWNYYFFGELDARLPPGDAQTRRLQSALHDTIGAFSAQDIPVLIVGTVPEFDWDVPACLSRSVHFGSSHTACNLERRNIDMRSGFTNKILRDTADSVATTAFVDPMELLCKDESCLASIDAGTILYSDKDHLTTEGARRVARWLWSEANTSKLHLFPSEKSVGATDVTERRPR